jgi:hypothetical protein
MFSSRHALGIELAVPGAACYSHYLDPNPRAHIPQIVVWRNNFNEVDISIPVDRTYDICFSQL